MASSKYTIDRFIETEDFAPWKIQMESILMKEGYDGVVASAAGVDKTATTFVTMDKQALAIIRPTLSNDVLQRV